MALAVPALSVPAPQRSSPHKLRATALLELTTDPSGTVTSRLFPITILADGGFQDAMIYESRPRPMALGTGVVYEAQKTGTPIGYLTLSGAINSLEGWVGEGRWQLPKESRPSSTPKPVTPTAPADDRPILHKGGDTARPSPQPEQQSAPTTPPSDDRPVLHRGGGDTTQQSPSQPSSSSTSPQQPSSTPPADQSDTAPPDPNRPVLRHRTSSTDDIESSPTPAPKTATAPSATTPPPQTIVTKPLPPPTPGVQTYVAVSDAQTSDIRSYEFNWRPDEKQQIEAKMRKLALAQIPGEGSQTNEHTLTNVVVRSFDLDMSNDAVVVITAEAPGAYLTSGTKAGRAAPPAKTQPDTKAPAGKFISRYITVIARVDIDGNPQKLAASVTDSSRLDVAPRLELIDAVDVDGDGLAELLFREYGLDQKSFIIYGVGHGSVTKVFEGASTPLNNEK